MKSRTAIAAALLCLSLSAAPQALSAEAAARPNIVLVVADDKYE
jgi:hypothetical protein